MENNTLISIVLPVFNGEKYLAKSIESCLNQTHTNLELIIVNDCSTDGTLTIANEYAKKDLRIKIINNTINKKLPASLNIGHKAALGSYITWTSDDNIYESNALETLLLTLSKSRSDIIYSDFFLIDESGQRIREVNLLNFENIIFGNFIGSSFLYKRAVFERNNGFNEQLFLVEDYDFWLRATLHSKYYHVKNKLYNYRKHNDSLTNQLQTDNYKNKLWRNNIHKMYSGFSANFSNNKFDILSELLTKNLSHQKIKFEWVKLNYNIFEEFKTRLLENPNFSDRRAVEKVFLNKMIELIILDFDHKKIKYDSFFIISKFFQYLNKNNLKTLIKFSFFK